MQIGAFVVSFPFYAAMELVEGHLKIVLVEAKKFAIKVERFGSASIFSPCAFFFVSTAVL